ncbi:hypothetical protein ACWEPL_60500, partial [Nonomuraea sp. NPDC004186]
MEHTFATFGFPGEPGSDEFWAAAGAPASVPAGDGWATLFLWRGSPASVGFESWSEPVPLRRWGDTDCWYAEVAMPARLRVTYRFGHRQRERGQPRGRRRRRQHGQPLGRGGRRAD